MLSALRGIICVVLLGVVSSVVATGHPPLRPAQQTAVANNHSSHNALSDPQRPFHVQSTQPWVDVRLSANKTTGFSWFLSHYNPAWVQPVSYHYQAPKTAMVGAPGVSVWRFKILPLAFVVPQRLSLDFEYQRPWELTPAKTIRFVVVTTPPNAS